MEELAWHVLLVQMATFVIGALLLWRIAYLPIREILTERRERIAAEQSKAEAARVSAEEAHRELRDRIAALEDDTRKRIAAAEVTAQKVRDEAAAEARAAAQKLLTAAREQGRRERAAQGEQMRKDAAKLAVAMARKLAGASVNAKDRKRLLDQVLRELPKRLEGSA